MIHNKSSFRLEVTSLVRKSNKGPVVGWSHGRRFSVHGCVLRRLPMDGTGAVERGWIEGRCTQWRVRWGLSHRGCRERWVGWDPMESDPTWVCDDTVASS